jgi:hypothetical protein
VQNGIVAWNGGGPNCSAVSGFQAGTRDAGSGAEELGEGAALGCCTAAGALGPASPPKIEGARARGGRLCKRPLPMKFDAVAAGAASASSISTGAASGCASIVRPRSMNQYTGALCLVPVVRAACAYSRSPRWHMKPARFR